LGAALPLPDYASEDQIGAVLELVRKAAENISSELGYLKI
jgi:DNA-binding IclR family transcriptional regulator